MCEEITTQARNICQDSLWVDKLVDEKDEVMTQLSPLTKPYVNSSHVVNGVSWETRSAFNNEQRECVYALVKDISTVVSPTDGLNKTFWLLRPSLPVAGNTTLEDNLSFFADELEELSAEYP